MERATSDNGTNGTTSKPQATLNEVRDGIEVLKQHHISSRANLAIGGLLGALGGFFIGKWIYGRET
jgi:ABC-type nitrate/sulfonate/bicarbonate transport system permease component